MQDWRADVDHWWAGVLRVPVAAMRAGGVFALGHVDHVGVVAADGAAAPVVYGRAVRPLGDQDLPLLAHLHEQTPRGLAGLVVTAAAREGLSRRPLMQYRAWHRNTASIAVAIRCGFAHYCDGLVIDLVP